MNITERFLHYVAFDTQSDESSETTPSTSKQLLLGEFLVEDMKVIGVQDVRIDEYGYVYGSVPGKEGAPIIGLISHMDTSPDCPGHDIKPRIIKYHGGDIVLNAEKNIILRESEFENLSKSRGKHLIVTDGNTLLGADDKAGIAEILTAVEELIESGVEHAPIRIAFTPDEEIGRGTDHFDLAHFGADYAYTSDGGTIGDMEYECFNAASARVIFHGVSIHPGSAKNKLVNSQQIAMEFHNMLPEHERPEYTEGYEGFAMLAGMEGNIERTELHYIIRDHDLVKFRQKQQRFSAITDYLNSKYGIGTVELAVKDTYYNMKNRLQSCMYVVDRAMDAMRKAGMEPRVIPIRGGTDGARLSYEGLPCPNLCTGGENYHGHFEYIPIEDMQQCVEMIKHILVDAAELDKAAM